MTQWVRVFAAKPDDLSFIPKSHMVIGERERERTTLECCPVTSTHAYTHTHAVNKCNKHLIKVRELLKLINMQIIP